MSKARILIVEDESIVAKDIEASLLAMGYTVAGMVATGEDAVARALELQPDLVLMDVMLKGDMDGIEAAGKIRMSCRIPVVYLTAYTDEDTLRRAKVSEAFGYLLKPFEENELRTNIEIALYKHSMDRQLRESREWLETTLHCICDGVVATDQEGNVQLINAAAENLTGWRRPEALGRRLNDVFCLKSQQPDGAEPLLLDDLLQGGCDSQLAKDVLLVGRAGGQTAVDCTAAPIRETDGRIFGVVLVVRDITEIKLATARERELHERLAHTRRMESLGTLAGGVAHDLNNILAPLVNYPDLITQALPGNSAIHADLKMIKNSARKAVDVVHDLLTLGRTGHIPLAPVDLNRVVSEAIKSVAATSVFEQAPLVSVETSLAKDLAPVPGSAQHLRELVANLVINAYADMPEGGLLRMATRVETLEKPLEGYEIVPPGSYVTLHTLDTGSGLQEDDIGRIFEPFYIKRKFRLQTVTGLGLAVVYAVVKEHKGYINVTSKTGDGTEITVYLPIDGEDAAGATGDAASDMRGTETILLVDDDDEQRRYSGRWLRSLGYKVLVAQNGRTALDVVKSADRDDAAIDLVLMDMIMADEMDGLDTMRQIQECHPRQKAVMVSGFAGTERIKEALKLCGGQYLQKPYTMEELGRGVRQALDS
ncbi:MAG: response regulator [Kiritimatiellia bacterium]|nr:response regulator [Lentisphaerota bacterium]